MWQLIEQRAARTGAMTHLATEEVDRGPLVSYVTVPLDTPQFAPHWQELSGCDATAISAIKDEQGEEYGLFRLIRAEQYAREPYLLLETLRAISLGEVALDVSRPGGEVTVLPGSACDPDSFGGLCLDERVEAAMVRDNASR